MDHQWKRPSEAGNLFNENDNEYEVTWLLAFLERAAASLSHSLLSQMRRGMASEASEENPNTMKDSRSSSLSYLLRGNAAVRLKMEMKTCWPNFEKNKNLIKLLVGRNVGLLIPGSYQKKVQPMALSQRAPLYWTVFAFPASLGVPHFTYICNYVVLYYKGQMLTKSDWSFSGCSRTPIPWMTAFHK